MLAREYSDPTFFDIHRLIVDAYAVQHPGKPSRQSIQSVGVHLIRLCLFHEHKLSLHHANEAMLQASKNNHTFIWLEPPVSLSLIIVSDVVNADSIDAHKSMVRNWAQTAWEAWQPHHNTVRKWLPAKYTFTTQSNKKSPEN